MSAPGLPPPPPLPPPPRRQRQTETARERERETRHKVCMRGVQAAGLERQVKALEGELAETREAARSLQMQVRQQPGEAGDRRGRGDE